MTPLSQRQRWQKFWVWLAWRLPRTLVYWYAIRVFANGTVNQYSHQVVSSLTVLEALERWENKTKESNNLLNRDALIREAQDTIEWRISLIQWEVFRQEPYVDGREELTFTEQVFQIKWRAYPRVRICYEYWITGENVQISGTKECSDTPQAQKGRT